MRDPLAAPWEAHRPKSAPKAGTRIGKFNAGVGMMNDEWRGEQKPSSSFIIPHSYFILSPYRSGSMFRGSP
jgi:hypothetical protein